MTLKGSFQPKLFHGFYDSMIAKPLVIFEWCLEEVHEACKKGKVVPAFEKGLKSLEKC